MRRMLATLGTLLLALALAGCAAPAGPIVLSAAQVRAAPATGATGGATSAAYLTIRNSRAADDALVGVSSDAAAAAELHSMSIDGDVMRMGPLAELAIPANGAVELRPGGAHIMLLGLRRDLRAGETVSLTLTFRDAGAVTVRAPVRAP